MEPNDGFTTGAQQIQCVEQAVEVVDALMQQAPRQSTTIYRDGQDIEAFELLAYDISQLSAPQCAETCLSIMSSHVADLAGAVTHKVVWPTKQDAVLQDDEDVIALYTTCGQLAFPHSVGVMERCMSYIHRLSVSVMIATPCKFDSTVHSICQQVAKLSYIGDEDDMMLTNGKHLCLILTPNGERDGVVQFILHWPQVGVYQHDYIRILDEIRATVVDATIDSRTASGYVPVYGSTSNTGEQPMLFHACVNEQWPLYTNLGKAGVYKIDESNLQQSMPFMTSINPVGNMVLLFAPESCPSDVRLRLGFEKNMLENHVTGIYEADEAWKRSLSTVTGLVNCLTARRRKCVLLQNEVGSAVFCALHASYEGFCIWLSWLRGDNTESDQFDMLLQWRQFSVRPHTNSGLRLLHGLAQLDSPALYAQHLDRERRSDHVGRQSGAPMNNSCPDLLSVMGSLTHMDIATFVVHEVRGNIVCTNTSGRGTWYVYKSHEHRWVFDADGPTVTLTCYRVLSAYVRRLREGVSLMEDAQENDEKEKRKQPFAFLVNFPADSNMQDVLRQTLVHLDTAIGDIRSIQCIVRAMVLQLYDSSFVQELDTKNDHIIPFANGVLDLKQGVLRPGICSDLVSKGPSYEWVDYTLADQTARDIEKIITTIFPDYTVRAFFMEVMASLLRKRNRYKHFYILSGNTNGGKSFLMQLLNAALGNLFCLIPVTAITARESDPSGHSDYLARTNGCSVCVCHEPDTGTQKILPDRLKVMTSDSDKLAVREIYGSTREMPITWKLMMACNSVPGLASVDAATVERCQFIAFNSMFVDKHNAPQTEHDQFQQRIFIANKDYSSQYISQLGRALMGVMFTVYMQKQMHAASYTLSPPRRLRLEIFSYLRDLTQFRSWVSSFVRPATILSADKLLPRGVEYALQKRSRIILQAIRDYTKVHGDSGVWHNLSESMQTDTAQTGSPGWVRHQCMQLLQLVLHYSSPANSSGIIEHEHVVDIETIIQNFNNYRRTRRNHHNLYNSSNTATPSAPQETESKTHKMYNIEMTTRMKLDPGLVKQVIKDVVGRDLFDTYQLGVVLITENSNIRYSDTQQHHMIVIRNALSLATMEWSQKYGIIPPSIDLLSANTIRKCIDKITLSRNDLVNQSELRWDDNNLRDVTCLEEIPGYTQMSSILTDNPTDIAAAEKCMMTNTFAEASECKNLSDASRIYKHDHGFSGIGAVKAIQMDCALDLLHRSEVHSKTPPFFTSGLHQDDTVDVHLDVGNICARANTTYPPIPQ